MDKVMEALKKDDGANLIRICGPGGVGKTTMVDKILSTVREEKMFEEVAKAVVSQKPDLKKIREAIAGQLRSTLEQPIEDLRAAELHESIVRSKKKFLLVLDDVWDELPFADIGLPSVGSGSYKILFTSRSKDVFLRSSGDSRRPAYFEVPTLSEEEAMHLFKESAGNCCEDQDILPIAKQVVKECGGVPIAIVTVGNALTAAGSNKHEWRDALRELKSGKHGERVETCIKLSYNYLKCEEQKGFFLLCCLFPEDADIPIETLLRYGMGMGLLKNNNYSIQDARDRVHTLVAKLRRLFLLLESEKAEHVRMHDVVRDVGTSIVSVDQECGAMHLCKYYENSDQVFNSTNLKLLWLSKLQPSTALNFFEGMKKLNVLTLSKEIGFAENLPELPPFQFQGLENIQALCLEGYDLSNIDLSAIGELGSLEILSFYGSHGVWLPSKLGLLTRLRLLDCTNTTSNFSLLQISYGVLSGLKQLENLFLGGNEVKWEMEEEGKEAVNASIAEFKCLCNLTTLAVTLPKPHQIDPKEWHFEKLIKFQIGMGLNIFQHNLEKNYDFANRLDISLKDEERIDRRMTSLINILLKKTEILNVYGERCSSYDSDGEENLFDLLQLSLKTGFSGGSPSLSHLQSLDVSYCHSLKYVLPSNIATDLLQLKSLRVQECNMIEQVFHLESSRRGEGEGAAITIKLPQLTHLELLRLPKLTAWSKSTSLSLCSNTEPIGSLFTLLPTKTKQFENLQALHIVDCPYVEVLFEFEKLENAANSILPQLQELHLIDLPELKHVWKNGAQARQGFQNLQFLQVSRCGNVEHIIGGGGEEEEEDKEGSAVTVLFPRLAKLQLIWLPYLLSFFSGNKCTLAWMSMKELVLEGCPKMKTFISSDIVNDASHHHDHYLFNEDVGSVKLSRFEIKNIGCEMIWHCKTQVFVEEMSVFHCHKLKNVLAYSSCDGIKMVETLLVYECDSLGVVFQIECEVGADLLCNGLIELNLCGLPKLNRIWNISSDHPHDLTIEAALIKQLRNLHIEECPSLRRVFSLSRSVVFPKLYDVIIEKCSMVEEIFGNDDEATTSTSINITTYLPNLAHLKLKHNAYLTSILKGMDAENATQFSLQDIIIGGCPKLIPSSFYISLLNSSELRNARIKFENQKVTLESTENSNIMRINGVEKLMDMLTLDGKSTPPGYLSNTHFVELRHLINFPAAAWWHYLQSLPNLVQLKISSCGSTEVIFSLEEGLNPKKLPQLVKLDLSRLEKLRCIWMKGVPRELSQRFHNLQELYVEECHSLRNVLTLSMVKHLPNLTTLTVHNCNMVEEICVEDEDVDISNETIEFPRVKDLTLGYLPNLTSFCAAAQVCAFNWHSLTEVYVTNCPRLETFTLAVSNTPMLKKVKTQSNKKQPLREDLNATIQLIFKQKE